MRYCRKPTSDEENVRDYRIDGLRESRRKDLNSNTPPQMVPTYLDDGLRGKTSNPEDVSDPFQSDGTSGELHHETAFRGSIGDSRSSVLRTPESRGKSPGERAVLAETRYSMGPVLLNENGSMSSSETYDKMYSTGTFQT